MKGKTIFLLVCIFIGVYLTAGGFGAWEEALTAYTQVTAAPPKKKTAPPADVRNNLLQSQATSSAAIVMAITDPVIPGPTIVFSENVTTESAITATTQQGIDAGEISTPAAVTVTSTPQGINIQE